MSLDTLEAIASSTLQISKIAKEVNVHKERSIRLCERIGELEPILARILQFETEDERTAYQEPLQKLNSCLKDATDFISQFRKEDTFLKTLKLEDIKSGFDDLNSLIDSVVPELLGFAITTRCDNFVDRKQKNNEDDEDERKDCEEFKTYLDGLRKGQEDLCNMVDSVKTEIKQSVARDSESGLKKSELRHISSNDLTVHEEIGSGRYGTVYRAECFADTVAVKKFTPKRGCIEGLKESLVKEATNMKRLDCDSVVRPFGICTEPDNCLVVMEFMQYRSLRDFLDNPPDDYDLTWKNRIWLALGGARGLYQLHSGKPPMLHRCISSDKFLVNKSKDVKISDFGLAKTKSSAVYHGSSKNTLNYIAPEHLKNLNEKYNDKSDVYGYGIVLWEIATSMKPFEGMSTQDLLKYVLIRKRKEELPIECPHDFRDIVERCRAHEPTTRPFTGEIVEKLETAHSAC